MDASAISLARENGLPIIVFNIHAPGAFAQVMRGEGRFTRMRTASAGGAHDDAERAIRSPRLTADGGGHDVPRRSELHLKQDLTRRMDGALETLRREFAGLRTGRASPACSSRCGSRPMAAKCR